MYEDDMFSDAPSGFEGTSPIEAIFNPARFLENMNLVDDARSLRACVAARLDQVCHEDGIIIIYNVKIDHFCYAVFIREANDPSRKT